MTDEQVIRILVEKVGWTSLYVNPRGEWFGFYPEEPISLTRSSMPNPILSKDALAPVLEKLSGKEWEWLHDELYKMSGCVGLQQRKMARYCLTLSAHDLAYAIVEAITATKK